MLEIPRGTSGMIDTAHLNYLNLFTTYKLNCAVYKTKVYGHTENKLKETKS